MVLPRLLYVNLEAPIEERNTMKEEEEEEEEGGGRERE